MEKIKTTIRKIENYEHQFYCDNCYKYLGSREEYNDGYYSTIGDFELKINLPDGWHKVKKCFCEECKEEYLSRLQNTLKDFGFKKDI